MNTSNLDYIVRSAELDRDSEEINILASQELELLKLELKKAQDLIKDLREELKDAYRSDSYK